MDISTGIWHPTLNECCGHMPEIEERNNKFAVYCMYCDKQTYWFGKAEVPYSTAGDKVREACDAWNNGEFVDWSLED
jgi:hypothetical protein